MAANTQPIFELTPICKTTQIATANTNRDGTGTLGTGPTGGASGTRIDRVSIKATGTTTQGKVRLYVDDGTNVRLVDELDVTAATPSASVSAFKGELVRQDGLPYLVLPSGHILKYSTHNAETFNVTAHGGDY